MTSDRKTHDRKTHDRKTHETLDTHPCMLPRETAQGIAARLQQLPIHMPEEDPRIYTFAKHLALDLSLNDYRTSSGAFAATAIVKFQRLYGSQFGPVAEGVTPSLIRFFDSFLPRLTRAVCPPDFAQQVVGWYNAVYHPASESGKK